MKTFNPQHIRYVTVEYSRCNWRGPERGVKEFATLDDAVRFVGEPVLKLRGGGTLVSFRHNVDSLYRPYSVCNPGDAYLFRDDSGTIIPVWKVQEAYRNLPWIEEYHYPYWHVRHRQHYNSETNFRKAPVPGIRRRRWHKVHRRLQTTQERRENSFVNLYDEDTLEYNIKCRGARTPRNLPTWWDDIPSSRQGNSWKNYRDTRWKKGAVSYRTLPHDDDDV
jgi:hypothetical protein